MGSQWQAVVVDAADPARLARWWAEVLGLRILREAPAEVTVGAGDGSLPVLHFARTNGAVPAPGRVQLDLQPDDPQGEVERLVNMGARPVDSGHEGGVLLADPEGNAFRVLHRASGGASV